MSCRSTKGRYLASESRCIITLITEYLTWLVKTKTWETLKRGEEKNERQEKKKKNTHRWWQVPAGDGWEGVFETWDERGTTRREGRRAEKEKRGMRKEQFFGNAKEILGG